MNLCLLTPRQDLWGTDYREDRNAGHCSAKWEVKSPLAKGKSCIHLLQFMLVISVLEFISLFVYLLLYLFIFPYSECSKALLTEKSILFPIPFPLSHYQLNTQHLQVIWNTLRLHDNSLTPVQHLFELESVRFKPPDSHCSHH